MKLHTFELETVYAQQSHIDIRINDNHNQADELR